MKNLFIILYVYAIIIKLKECYHVQANDIHLNVESNNCIIRLKLNDSRYINGEFLNSNTLFFFTEKYKKVEYIDLLKNDFKFEVCYKNMEKEYKDSVFVYYKFNHSFNCLYDYTNRYRIHNCNYIYIGNHLTCYVSKIVVSNYKTLFIMNMYKYVDKDFLSFNVRDENYNYVGTIYYYHQSIIYNKYSYNYVNLLIAVHTSEFTNIYNKNNISNLKCESTIKHKSIFKKFWNGLKMIFD